jgi:hypothetical protein
MNLNSENLPTLQGTALEISSANRIRKEMLEDLIQKNTIESTFNQIKATSNANWWIKNRSYDLSQADIEKLNKLAWFDSQNINCLPSPSKLMFDNMISNGGTLKKLKYEFHTTSVIYSHILTTFDNKKFIINEKHLLTNIEK